jgi:predicted nucleic acid-binding protein
VAKAKWNLPDFNGVICEYEAKAAELDDAAYECVEKAQEIQYNAMLDGLRRHRKTGASMKALRKRPIERDANRTYTDLRIELHKGGEDDGFWGAVAQEYGTKRFTKDPWMRPAIDKSKAKIEAAWRAIFARRGYPMK